MTRSEQMIKVQDEALEIFEKKNADYGDAFAEYGPVGVLVRMGDKIRRCVSLTASGVQMVDDERLRDTVMDLYNYASMFIMLLDEKERDDDENESQ